LARKSPSTITAVKDDQPVDSAIDELLTQKQASWDAMRPIQATWSDRERLLINRPADSYTQKTTKSHVTDAHISTLAFERQARVAAQLPTGIIYSLTSKDEQPAFLMNLILNKYILPSANSQMDALSKLRMSGVYASVYGACPMMYDYRVDDEYIGPDFWIIQPRNFFPQPGKNSIRDCDWVMISEIRSISFFDAILKREKTSWNKKAINKLKELTKDGATPARDIDSSKKSAIENVRTAGRPYADKGSAARVELVTKYEKGTTGHWITFAPDYKEAGVLRDIPNPHANGRIPIVMRQCFPLVESIWGLGDFERGITLQKAKDSLINLYLDGVKLAIFKPLKIDVANVTMSSIKMEAGARWLMKDPNAVAPYDSGGAEALQNFQGTYEFLTSALLNQFGSNQQQVSKNDSGNPALGRTPQAIEAQNQREDARDNWDRFQLEKCLEDLLEGMINLLAEKQEKPINFHIFDADVEQVMQRFGTTSASGEVIKAPDFMSPMGRSAKLTVAKSLIKGAYRYIVDASSTMREQEEAQNESLVQIMNLYIANPQVYDQLLQREGYQFKFGSALKTFIYNSGINDPDSIITKINQQPGQQGQPGQPVQMQPAQINPAHLQSIQDPQIRQVAQQLFGQGGQPQQPQQPQQPPMTQQPMPQMQGAMPNGQ
jgi:hypothetical protein